MASENQFDWEVERFADLRVLRYQVPHWDQLPKEAKILAYWLVEAGRSGSDILFDQNYKHNLRIRRILLLIWKSKDLICKWMALDGRLDEWAQLEEYIKQFFFSSGIHHHYSNDKFIPKFTPSFFEQCLKIADPSKTTKISEEIFSAIFDSTVAMKKVEQNDEDDILRASAVNFYQGDITKPEAEAYFHSLEKEQNLNTSEEVFPVSHGLNSQLVRSMSDPTKLLERKYKVGGLYGQALEKIIINLQRAKEYAPADMADGLDLLISYFRTGDLETWDRYCVHWTQEKGNLVDYILGFIEIYDDPLQKHATFESIVQIVDLNATAKMRVLQENAQYFEDNSPTLPQHKRENCVGVTFSFINTASNSGATAPASPIGVNLPNANWIRSRYGSKSISLGNISNAHDQALSKEFLDNYCYDHEIAERKVRWGELADTLHTALHEVIGHGSGKLEDPSNEHRLDVYQSTIEEGRADLVALYFFMDPKLIEFGLMPNIEVGKNAYDDYITNGLMWQLRRIKLGKTIEEAHMRNRHWISKWVYEKGLPENVIESKIRDGRTYFIVNDYEKLQKLFGDLLREVQRIRSQGDLPAAKALVEEYGVKIDPVFHQEVLDRFKKLNLAPYNGFVQQTYIPVFDEMGDLVDVKLDTKKWGFMEQSVYFAERYNYLPDYP